MLAAPPAEAAREYVPGEVLVRYKPAPAARSLEAPRQKLRARYAATVTARTPATGVERWTLANTTADCTAAAQAIAREADVAYAEPNYIYHISRVPNDPRFPQQWALQNTGQDGGTPDADIDATEAWEFSRGGEVIVGVVDTGIDYTHEDLASNMWRNPGETPGDGIDNDGNGYVDDVFGIDEYNHDSDPMDDESHGSHCAGIIAAYGDNGVGTAGACWRVRLMALKFLSGSGSGNSFDAATCIEYAVRHGARVLNNSWGGGAYSSTLLDAIEFARMSNVLFCASAGNGGSDGIGDDNDSVARYPSTYTNGNIIAVAATDQNDNLTSFSNYGIESVDLSAPGYKILSTVPNNGYQLKDGTSMATPYVTGAAALLLAYNEYLNVAQVRDALLDTVDVVNSLTGRVVTGGRLNVYSALQALDGLFFDRVEYFVNTQVYVLAVASQFEASNAIGVTVSTDQGDSEQLLLARRDAGGYAFTNSIRLVYGLAAPGNGQLEGMHGAMLSAIRPGIAATGVAHVVLGLQVYISTPAQTVPYGTTSMAVRGSNNGTVPCGMTASNAATGQALAFIATNGWTAPTLELATSHGENTIVVFGTNAFGFAGTSSVVIARFGPAGATNYVAPQSGSHAWPYATWAEAATSLYAAISTAPDGNVVRVAPGRYAGSTLVLDRAITLEGVDGAAATIIDGEGARHCLEVTTAAVVRGFTLVNGTNRYGGGAYLYDGALHDCIVMSNSVSYDGAGIYVYASAKPGTLVSNCTVLYNHAGRSGGGIALSPRAAAYACTIAGNSAVEDGGGGYANHGGVFVRCIITNNSASGNGGGVALDMFLSSNGIVRSSLIAHNYAIKFGGGVDLYYAGLVDGCTIIDNSTEYLGGGGVHTFRGGDVRNSIVYHNTAAVGDNYFNQDSGWSYRYTCIAPDPGGAGNTTAGPAFADPQRRDAQLHGVSPCIDTGTNADAGTEWDLAGNPRVNSADIDMGAYEYIPGALQCAFDADATNVVIGTTVWFTPRFWGTNTSITECVWDVDGDGGAEFSVFDTQAVAYAYLTEGVYTVTLTVTNSARTYAVFTRAGYLHVAPEPHLIAIVGAGVALIVRRIGRQMFTRCA
jgi:subtilisin family serine protease